MNLNKIFKVASQLGAPSTGAGAFFVCTEDSTALLIRRSERVSEPGTWGISGGTVEAKETPEKGAYRETIEELGSMPKQLRFIHKMNNNINGNYHIYIFDIPLVEKRNWTTKIILNYESSEYKWFPLGDLPDNLHSAISIIKA